MTQDAARLEIVEASRILAAQGLLDAFGHVSRRCPDRPDRFLISRSLAPALVTIDDVLEIDFDGRPTLEQAPNVFLERFIHSEIYKLRPQVESVVHSHALTVVPFTVVPSVQLRPICHMCGFLHGTPSPFDVADHVGSESNLLVGNSALGHALASHLGNASIVLMRGHGFTAVGENVPQAVYRAIYTAKNCEIQSAALRLGDPIYLSEAEARACDTTATSQIGRAWGLWKHELARSEDMKGQS